jgi:Tfp pilus assembly protein PilF
VSLLLDALKRAEQEKLARSPASAAPPAAVPSGPRAVATASLELQPVAPAAVPPPVATLAPKAGVSAQAAQNVFQAKAANPVPERGGRGMLWATIGAIAIVVIAAGAYVWHSVSALTPKVVAVQRPAPISTRVPGAGAPPALSPPPAAQPVPATPLAAPEPPARVATLTAAAPAAPPAPPRQAVLDELAREAATQTPEAPYRLDRSEQAPRRVPADVSSGYEALRQGDLPAARRSYEAALASDPASVDARLGLATVEARSGNRAAAALHYRRSLELDPRDPTALAGLASLADFSRPEMLEAQLRSDLARHPGSGALRFTLGNLYATQGRWTEAQAEYFEAHRLDPGNADVAFNLAVSLDHLGQRSVAAGFYRRALEAARTQRAQFDPGAVARRLAELR